MPTLGRLRSLLRRRSSHADPTNPESSRPSPEEQKSNPSQDNTPLGEPPTTPTSPSQFLKRLGDNPSTPTRQLLQPYLAYELWLRKGFARGHPGVSDGLASLIPIYNGCQNLLTIRNLDREREDQAKYLMLVPEEKREENGVLAIVPSIDEYSKNFDAFTHGILAGLDWSNVVAAGSSALLPLLSRRKDVDYEEDPGVQDPRETYFQTIASSSDIDLFLYGLEDEEAAIKRIFELEAQIRRNQRLSSDAALTLRTEHAITFISPRYPYRHVQIILRLYKSISEILTGFDVDCACVAFDGKQVYSNPRGVAAIATRTNTIDLTRRSPSYENRLFKYRWHNFDVYWDGLDRSRIHINWDPYDDEFSPRQLIGLSRLVFFEGIVAEPEQKYHQRRRLRKIQESGDPLLTTPSGYAVLEIPYGERFTAARVRKYVDQHAKESPHFFGTIDEVVIQGMKRTKKNKGQLSGKVTFIKDDPGRQMIGSFHPITDDDWTKIAYEGLPEDS
ncbi:hypothetical protein Aspvir_009136 [Aspergillus viridinutans]|uniref:Uncharacterized protein n=1 Tax=Aspergillus viridinutans TaxID=75553 RepID=A0A9P3F4A8_ASPVI|nr:uncharacterized protein Aspvir_009136 [Aspergillus viridinutans]GIK05037.1 hypothetical protein Aspvir_009136 [Aspergillus viridinutans]